MAYLRKEKETLEVAYSLNRVWKTISKVLRSLEWDIEQIDDVTHHVKAKTKSSLMSWGAVLLIDAVAVDRSTTRVSVLAEVPVTTITAMFQFGQARQRIGLFFTEMAKQLAS